jgi:hypothetical protein
MEYPGRLLKRGRSGSDVKAAKDRLVELGYLFRSTHGTYGNDTYEAVKAFQRANNLEADGIIGPLTWSVLFPPDKKTEQPVAATEIPAHIGAAAAKVISVELAQVSEIRRKMCLEALNHCIDPNGDRTTLRSFYIRGGNLYNKDLSANVMKKSALSAYFKKAGYKEYYNNGRQEMMTEHAERAGYTQTGADCSGGIVGLLRKFKVYAADFDATADNLYGNHSSKTKKPQPGDFAWKSGHIGLYVGGGYVVEWAGGAYGCQLTKAKDRRAFDFVKGKMVKLGAWKAYGDPKRY